MEPLQMRQIRAVLLTLMKSMYRTDVPTLLDVMIQVIPDLKYRKPAVMATKIVMMATFAQMTDVRTKSA
jgi:hypothetical protein